METIPVPESKAEITELVERIRRGHVDCAFAENGRPAVVMMSVARYESLTETLDVLSDPEVRADLAESTDSEEFTTEEEMVGFLRHRLGGDHPV